MSIIDSISTSYIRRDKESLEKIISELIKSKNELDVFFEEYLEVFDEKLNASINNQNTPVWKCYKDKYKVWQKINADLKVAKYYLGMI